MKNALQTSFIDQIHTHLSFYFELTIIKYNNMYVFLMEFVHIRLYLSLA